MKPMSEQAQALIDAARSLEAPPAGAQSALRAALDAKLAAGAVAVGAGTAAHGAMGAGGVAAKSAAIGASLTAKIVVGALVTVGVGTVGTVAVRQVVIERHAAIERARSVSVSPVVVQPPAIVALPPDEPPPRRSGPRVIATPPPRPVPAVPVDKEPACGMAQEVKLLQQAQHDLQEHRPEQVLAALDRATTTCPGASLEQERLAVRILALCQLGRHDEARAATERLEREAPQSPSLDRIRSECL